MTYSNNLEKIETIRNDGLMEGADPTIAALTGRIDVRFADTTLIDLAAGGTPVDLEFAYTRSAQAKLVLTAHEIYLPKPKLAVEGPGGVQASFDFRGAKNDVAGRMLTSRSRTTSTERYTSEPFGARQELNLHAPRYHGGGFAGSGLLPDEVPIIARRGELVVPPERVVREEKTAREQRPVTVVVNVTAADASSFRASQGQIAADMARAIIGRAGTGERGSVPRRHGNAQGVALVIAAAAAAKLALEVEQPGVRRPSVLQQPGVDVGPPAARRTGREDTCQARRSSSRMA